MRTLNTITAVNASRVDLQDHRYVIGSVEYLAAASNSPRASVGTGTFAAPLAHKQAAHVQANPGAERTGLPTLRTGLSQGRCPQLSPRKHQAWQLAHQAMSPALATRLN